MLVAATESTAATDASPVVVLVFVRVSFLNTKPRTHDDHGDDKYSLSKNVQHTKCNRITLSC